MPSDEVVWNQQQVASAPVDYTVPDSVEYEIKTVTATFDGTSSSGTYLPALQVISDGGIILATFVDPTTAVLQGASAEVTFGPF